MSHLTIKFVKKIETLPNSNVTLMYLDKGMPNYYLTDALKRNIVEMIGGKVVFLV